MNPLTWCSCRRFINNIEIARESPSLCAVPPTPRDVLAIDLHGPTRDRALRSHVAHGPAAARDPDGRPRRRARCGRVRAGGALRLARIPACLCAIFAATFPDRVSALALYGVAAAGVASDDFPWQWINRRVGATISESLPKDGGPARTRRRLSPCSTRRLPTTSVTSIGGRDSCDRPQAQTRSPRGDRAHMATDRHPSGSCRPSRVPTLVPPAGRRPGRGPSKQVATSPTGSRRPASWSSREEMTNPGPATKTGAGRGRAVPDRERGTSGRRACARDGPVHRLVGSTERAVELGDARWKELLASHQTMVRAELATYRGREVDTAGDGFFAIFDGPARAVRCARAAIDAVRSLGLEVRAGVHTGEVEASRGDVRGVAVHIGARVARCRPNEILVTSTVRDLVAGSGLAFEDNGEHDLRVCPSPWRLYRVVT